MGIILSRTELEANDARFGGLEGARESELCWKVTAVGREAEEVAAR